MERVLTVEAMRKSDTATIASGIPSIELMRRAAEGLFHAARWVSPVGILCGSGNNAGDGYALALYLHQTGIESHLYLAKEAWSEDGRYYFEQCLKKGIPWTLWQEGISLSDCGSVCDCLFGTGFHENARGTAADMIEESNRSGAYVVSCDINSGLNGDTGRGECVIQSDLTVAIGDFKPGHFIGEAERFIRKAVRVDIGIQPQEKPWLYLDGRETAIIKASLLEENKILSTEKETLPETIQEELKENAWTERNWEGAKLLITREQIYLTKE